ncbi:c-type cytochrome [Membranihabitans marinus]|uniref:c-type cytochrome n=1 Tax=Membranihabitans marinus TaxID=1227546 RepID=UPI001F02FB3D|nr:c-type cytochrome [Membranihabitans marinus]
MNIKRILLISVMILLIGLGVVLSYVKLALPNVGPPEDIKIEITDKRLERGEYLANHVTLCMDCHSTREWDVFSGPLKEGSNGMGGEIFNEDLGFPGNYVSPNITPFNLSSWTDGEIFRAITSGVNKHGKALFPIMPYKNFGQLAREDIYSIIAYIRSLPSIENTPSPSVSYFPFNFILNTIPTKGETLEKIPSKENTVEYGKYMTTAAGCYDCHTNQKDGKIIGDDFAGGFEFKLLSGGIVRSSNITPHDTGIKSWSEKDFINRFKIFQDSTYLPQKVEEGEFQTIMPWSMYAGMKSEDLAAIYGYLQTLEPKENVVEKFSIAVK